MRKFGGEINQVFNGSPVYWSFVEKCPVESLFLDGKTARPVFNNGVGVGIQLSKELLCISPLLMKLPQDLGQSADVIDKKAVGYAVVNSPLFCGIRHIRRGIISSAVSRPRSSEKKAVYAVADQIRIL